MRFAIIGRAQSGKSTFAAYLAEYLDLKVSNTSDWLIEVETFRRKRLHALEPHVLTSPDFNKAESRSWLIALGDAVCAIQPGFLIEQAFRRASIITGIRRREEFQNLPKDVITILIERDSSIADNFDIPSEDVEYTVKNDGDLAALKNAAHVIAQEYLSNVADKIKRRG